MKSSEIHVGSVYLVKVSGKVVPVRVLSSRDEQRKNGHYEVWRCVHELTSREVTVRSCQRFRQLVKTPAHVIHDLNQERGRA